MRMAYLCCPDDNPFVCRVIGYFLRLSNKLFSPARDPSAWCGCGCGWERKVGIYDTHEQRSATASTGESPRTVQSEHAILSLVRVFVFSAHCQLTTTPIEAAYAATRALTPHAYIHVSVMLSMKVHIQALFFTRKMRRGNLLQKRRSLRKSSRAPEHPAALA